VPAVVERRVPPTNVYKVAARSMFYTPGWGAVLTLTGTLGGVAITQAVNSAIGWRARRKDRNERITESVSELVASGNSWVYAVCAQEQDLLHAVATRVSEEKLMEMLTSARAADYSAQLEFGRALARVRLTCPPKVVAAAEDFRIAVHGFEEVSREKGVVALRVRSVDGIEATDPVGVGVVHLLSRLVDVTRKATGYGPRPDKSAGF
jgi:hypothetical protein